VRRTVVNRSACAGAVLTTLVRGSRCDHIVLVVETNPGPLAVASWSSRSRSRGVAFNARCTEIVAAGTCVGFMALLQLVPRTIEKEVQMFVMTAIEVILE
jgi:hypothetical protein